ncbi:LytR/AlgR family response regulator transcription factor [Novosphingobium aquiterrae]|uniref:LytR/AlgR family response regulator transcription factor n=1 Tax=Novosphingobium aquiterrae TaxID=624388 RepID=A0ABV6PKP7_9SPHN
MNRVDVLVVDDEPLARRRVVRLLKHLAWVGAVEEAGNVEQAIQRLATFQAGLVLLDIQMPGGSGFDLVERLPDPAPAIVFITAFDDQALRAFDSRAVDYITKPIDPGRFHEALERARIAAEQRSNTDRIRELEEVVTALRKQSSTQPDRRLEIWVKSKGDYVRLAPGNISHIAAERDYVRIHAEGVEYLYNRNLAALERSLPSAQFIRIHRSTIVRIDAIKRIKQDAFSALVVVLGGGVELRVGRTYTSNIRSRLMNQG